MEDRASLIALFQSKKAEHDQLENQLRESQVNMDQMRRDLEKTEEDLDVLQIVGQVIGDVLRQIDDAEFANRSL
jgi:26S proteasome regulatory subunit T4